MEYEIKKLKDVSYLAGRIGWKGLTAKEYTKNGPLFLSVHSLNYGDYVDFIDAFHISQERYDESPEIMLRNNDILLCKDGAGIGKLGIIDRLPGPASINSSLLLIRANEEVEPKYLYRVLCGPLFQRVVQERIDGATTPHLYQREIKELEVPLPPLPEQQRIVAILDEAFAGIDQAIANTEKNLASAREIFESYVHSLLIKNNCGWSEKKIGELCSLYQGLAINKGTKHLLVEKSKLPLLRIKDLRNNSEEQYISEHGFPPNTEIFPEDIIYTRTGQIGLVFTGRRGVLHNNSFKIEPNAELDRDYLFWWLQEPIFRQRIISLASRAAQPDITHKLFKEQIILLPPLRYQKEAAEKINWVFVKIETVSGYYKQKLTSLNELKQSLLQKAFSGELTADIAADAEAAE